MATVETSPEWTMGIFVPGNAAAAEDDEITPGASSTLHSKGLLKGLFGDEEKHVDAQSILTQWKETVTGTIGAVNDWSKAALGEWRIDEVNVEFTVSAEGKLLFIAKAGGSGTIKLKLTRSGTSAA